jgi:hypothetical protein
MTTQPNEIPVTVDYTSRDYFSIRNDLIARVQSNINVPGTGVSWTGTDPSDFGVAILEAFAYMGDIINYYIDRVANENYISTATQRQSIIDIARTYGYYPSGYRAASCTLIFSNPTASAITVPAGTQVSGQVTFNDVVEEIIFTTTTDVVVPAASGGVSGESAQVTAYHGELVSTRSGNDINYGELVGVSDGTPDQSFVLYENQVVENSIQVFVEVGDGANYTQWQQVTHLADSTYSDPVYTIETDADNFVYINFGDGVSGAIPTNGSAIKVNYYVGGGQMGNVTAGTLDIIRYAAPGVDLSALTVVNDTSGTGGSDPESNDSIRNNAPNALSAINRAVTLKDYSNLAITVPNVGKANAVATNKNSVTVYVSPQQSSSVTDLYPGYTGDPTSDGVLSADWPQFVESVSTYLADKVQIGVSVTVAQPTYVPVHLLLRYTKYPQYSDTQVKSNIMLALVNVFSYGYMDFGDVLTPEEIEYQIRQVDGVYNASVIALYRDGMTGRNTLLGAPGEIFVFDEANLDVVANDANATLSAFTTSVGTLSPAFTSSLFNYNLPVPNGTTTTNFTPTNSTGTIRVNGTVVASGAATPVSIPVGVSTATIQVTAQDNITTNTYNVNITRAS